MDLRDFFRGFFGFPPQPQTPWDWRSGSDQHSQREVPPSLNVDKEIETGLDDVPGSHRRTPLFMFGDMFSVMEDMFKDVEQSMRDLDQVFDNFEFKDMDGFSPSSALPPGLWLDKGTSTMDLPPLPPRSSCDENIRSLVLKEDEQLPGDTEKVDKDLDELYNSRKIDISELPLQKNNPDSSTIVGRPTPRLGTSSYERVYSTYSFNNGKWEGKTVREDANGKEITSYYRNENGELDQTTDFFPKHNANAPEFPVDRKYSTIPIISLLERFFKSN